MITVVSIAMVYCWQHLTGLHIGKFEMAAQL